MNVAQRRVLILGAAAAAAMVLLPPYREVWPTRIINLGYQPLFLPPSVYASVNVSLLAVQLAVVVGIAGVLWLAFRGRR